MKMNNFMLIVSLVLVNLLIQSAAIMENRGLIVLQNDTKDPIELELNGTPMVPYLQSGKARQLNSRDIKSVRAKFASDVLPTFYRTLELEKVIEETSNKDALVKLISGALGRVKVDKVTYDKKSFDERARNFDEKIGPDIEN